MWESKDLELDASYVILDENINLFDPKFPNL